MTRKYPFFLSANDLTALAELGFLFGAEEMLTFRTRCGNINNIIVCTAVSNLCLDLNC